jgi:hypothetical protein
VGVFPSNFLKLREKICGDLNPDSKNNASIENLNGLD